MLGQDYRYISVSFLVQTIMKTLKFASETNWPLITTVFSTPIINVTKYFLSYNFSELFDVWKIVDCDTQAGNSMTKVDIVRMLSGGGVGVWVNDDGN